MLNRLLRNGGTAGKGTGKRFGTDFVLAKYTNGILAKAEANDFGHSLRKYDRLQHKTEHLIVEHQTAHVLLDGARGLATISDCYKLLKRDMDTGQRFGINARPVDFRDVNQFALVGNVPPESETRTKSAVRDGDFVLAGRNGNELVPVDFDVADEHFGLRPRISAELTIDGEEGFCTIGGVFRLVRRNVRGVIKELRKRKLPVFGKRHHKVRAVLCGRIGPNPSRMHLKNPQPHQMDIAFLIYQNPEINFGDVSRGHFTYDIVSPMNPPFPDVPVLYGGRSPDFTAKFKPFKPIYNKYFALNIKPAR